MTFTHETNGELVSLRINGVLDAVTVPSLRRELEGIANRGAREVHIDLSELELIDSSGVAALVYLFKQMRSRGGAVVLHGVKDQPLAVLRLLKLDRVFSL